MPDVPRCVQTAWEKHITGQCLYLFSHSRVTSLPSLSPSWAVPTDKTLSAWFPMALYPWTETNLSLWGLENLAGKQKLWSLLYLLKVTLLLILFTQQLLPFK